MTWSNEMLSGLPAAAGVIAALAAVSVLEIAWPLVPRSARRGWARRRWRSNLALSALTLVLNLAIGGALVVVLAIQAEHDLALLPRLALPPALELAVAIVVLDLSFYVCHVAMHARPGFWRFHAVHHADPMVDATTTLRQHPGETLIRFAFTGAFACAIGASPAAYAVYRSAVAFTALLEHANLRIPHRLDVALSFVTTWPGFHKNHHARDVARTDSNYGNLLSLWDRLFATAMPIPSEGPACYGLDGFADAPSQSVSGLLARPFRCASRRSRARCRALSAPSSTAPLATSPESPGSGTAAQVEFNAKRPFALSGV